ncbi:hypothetical protein PHMEG_0002328 [Phytophthora megakarya]|uniref:Uncharacterized protein n=1 Tax=Phytophthora megakarya TaxID=4795 RepID=A0A225WZH1_9STRA|nr:hypothetical protein PHMEG_0002328 [Phytophthora megakarya]
MILPLPTWPVSWSTNSPSLLAVAGLTASVNAHSNMILPLPTWPVSWSTNSPSGLIEGDTYLPVPDGMSYSTDPADNTEAYWTAFNSSNYTSLLEFAKETQVLQTMATFGTATAECGFSLANGTARALPAEVEWNQLTSSHEGPCEVWCDDTLVFEDWNCAVDYTSDPAKLPYDVSKCEGASMLTSIWLALHALPWQVYTNCAPLTGGLSSSVDSSTVTDDSSTTSATTTTTTGDTYLPVPDGMSYSTDPADNTEAYWTAFNKSTYTSLKDLVDKTAEVQTQSPFGTATLECGYSLANVDYTSDPAKLPYDKTKCESASMLTSYWIALHGLPWQVYINYNHCTINYNGDYYNTYDSSFNGSNVC